MGPGLLSDAFLAGGLTSLGRPDGFGGREEDRSLADVTEEVEVSGGAEGSFLGRSL